jgi:SAM-dependent methyltransferase
MPDLSIALPSGALEEAFLRIVDPEGKLPAALEALGPVVDRDVVVLDCGRGFRARQLAEMGARVAAFEFPLCDAASEELAGWVGRADAVVVPWSEMAAPGSRFIAEAGALLRPGGRLLIVHDYGRDDVWGLLPELRERDVAWSQRRGPFLGDGFRIRVIHCWWAFESMEQARELLSTVFGAVGVEAAEKMKRLRLEYSIAIYHRSAPGVVGTDGLETDVDSAVTDVAGAATAGAAPGLVPSSAR